MLFVAPIVALMVLGSCCWRVDASRYCAYHPEAPECVAYLRDRPHYRYSNPWSAACQAGVEDPQCGEEERPDEDGVLAPAPSMSPLPDDYEDGGSLANDEEPRWWRVLAAALGPGGTKLLPALLFGTPFFDSLFILFYEFLFLK